MNILIAGTGALGCYYGAKLAKSNVNVNFLSRGESYKEIKKNGLYIDSDLEESFHIDVEVINKLEDSHRFDLIIIAVKSYDVLNLVSQFPKEILKHGKFMTLQNGLMSEDIWLQSIRETQLYPVSAFVGLRKTDFNRVHHSGGGRYQFGPYLEGEMSSASTEIYNLFEKARIDVHYTSEIIKIKWGKLLWNASYNPLTTITQLKLGPVVKSEYGVNLLRTSMNETKEIAAAYGIELSDTYIQKQIELPEKLYSFKTSMLQDFINGNELELEAILGDLIQKGLDKGIEAKTLACFYSLVQLLLEKRETKL